MFTKCKENLEEGRRLENISWRLWHRSSSFNSAIPETEKKNNTTRDNNLASVFTTLPNTMAAYCPRQRIGIVLDDTTSSVPLSDSTHHTSITTTSTTLQPGSIESSETTLKMNEDDSYSFGPQFSQSYQPKSVHFQQQQEQGFKRHNQAQTTRNRIQEQINDRHDNQEFNYHDSQYFDRKNKRHPSSHKKINFYDRFTETYQQKGLIGKINNETISQDTIFTNDESSDNDGSDDEFLEEFPSEDEQDNEDICISPESYSAYVSRQEKNSTMFKKQSPGLYNQRKAHHQYREDLFHTNPKQNRHTNQTHYLQDTPKNMSALTIGLGLIKINPISSSSKQINLNTLNLKRKNHVDMLIHDGGLLKKSITTKAYLSNEIQGTSQKTCSSVFDRGLLNVW